MELVNILPVHRYSVDIFSYSGPLGIFGSGRNQNTTYAGARGIELLHFPLVLMNKLNKTESAVF